jgi:hypothetical protein
MAQSNNALAQCLLTSLQVVGSHWIPPYSKPMSRSMHIHFQSSFSTLQLPSGVMAIHNNMACNSHYSEAGIRSDQYMQDDEFSHK